MAWNNQLERTWRPTSPDSTELESGYTHPPDPSRLRPDLRNLYDQVDTQPDWQAYSMSEASQDDDFMVIDDSVASDVLNDKQRRCAEDLARTMRVPPHGKRRISQVEEDEENMMRYPLAKQHHGASADFSQKLQHRWPPGSSLDIQASASSEINEAVLDAIYPSRYPSVPAGDISFPATPPTSSYSSSPPSRKRRPSLGNANPTNTAFSFLSDSHDKISEHCPPHPANPLQVMRALHKQNETEKALRGCV